MKTYIRNTLIAATVVLSLTLKAHAGDGSIGTTSTGSTTVNLTVDKLILISGITTPVNLSSFTGSGAKTNNQDIIISGNNDDASPTYTVNITDGSCNNGVFNLARTAGTAFDIPVTVTWKDNTNALTGTSTALTCAADLTGQTRLNTTLADNTRNANLKFDITQANMRLAPAGDYSALFTIVVTPE